MLTRLSAAGRAQYHHTAATRARDSTWRSCCAIGTKGLTSLLRAARLHGRGRVSVRSLVRGRTVIPSTSRHRSPRPAATVGTLPWRCPPPETRQRRYPGRVSNSDQSSGALYDVPNDKSIVQVLRRTAWKWRTSCESGLCGRAAHATSKAIRAPRLRARRRRAE
jgi:hypothetical protein